MPQAVAQSIILGDWGTSRLRLFRFCDGVEAGRIDGPGIAKLDASPATVLMRAVDPWRRDGVIASITLCGMAGARGGLVEAGYLECPADALDWRQNATALMLDHVSVRVMAGLRCRNPMGAPDVMRGEEAQIFGAIALDASLARGRYSFVLPGTHCKWVSVVDGRVEAFRTYPTGELYALLSEHSTLIAPGKAEGNDGDAGFAHGLARSAEPTLGALFEARAAQLVDGRSPGWARGFLSGLLIGGEVAAEAHPGLQPILVGDPKLCSRYGIALKAAGCRSRSIDGDVAVLAGLGLAKG
jgi:2-dehydro-3-deoxygalactonokinase